MKLARVIERVLLLGRFSYTLREQKRERERQNIVLFPGDVTLLAYFMLTYDVCTYVHDVKMVYSRIT